MGNMRAKRAKWNILVSLFSQAVTLICGLIVPRLMIGAFGSEAYGATSSITQFLAYITLLEAGIGGVARAALYKPLAENNDYMISAVVSEIKRFFRIIGYIFFIYVVIIAFFFKDISHLEFMEWGSTVQLVLVISMSAFAQYFIGISYSVLLQAAQRTYITKIISTITTLLNTIAVIILIRMQCSIIFVKFISSLVFAIKPVLMFVYVKKKFNIIPVKEKNSKLLEQKWSGLGQHLAYFLHSNTDVAVLTLLANLKTVAVYSVYNMVVSHIQSITTSFSTGMEAVFGDMIAKDEKDTLRQTFGYYETLISYISSILYSTTLVLIIPFIKIYTSNIVDYNYIHPTFAVLIVIASLLYCLRMPYHSMIIAGGKFKQTRIAAYGEAVINIVLSLILVQKLSLVGVAIGTVAAVMFRYVYYAVYLSKNIFNRNILLFLKRLTINSVSVASVYGIGRIVLNAFSIYDYISWLGAAVAIIIVSFVCVSLSTFVFYKKDFGVLLNRIRPNRN